MQKLLNPIKNQLLRWQRYKDRKNPFQAFEEIRKDDVLEAPNKGAIIVGPIKMSGTAHSFEGLVAYHFRKRGYKVYAILCGQKLSYCENKGLKNRDFLKCSLCYAEQLQFLKAFDIEPLWIGDYISKDEEASIASAVQDVSLDAIRYKGEDLSIHVKSGLMRILKSSDISEDQIGLLKNYAKTSFTTFVSTQNMLKKLNPKHVVLSHGTYSTWGSLLQACTVENVHSVVWGRGYVGTGNFMATHNVSYLYENSQEPVENFNELLLTQEQIDKTLDYFAGKRNVNSKVDYVNYYSGHGDISATIDIRKELNLDPSKKIIGMFPNIPWDGQAFASSEAFPSIREFVECSVEWAKNEDVYLIIRAHPAEKHSRSIGQLETFENILFDMYSELPDNVIFLPADHKIVSYQLEEHVSFALLYAGTLGLEFTINGTPVIQVGKNANTNKGFIFEPASIEELRLLLSKGIGSGLELTDEMKSNCIKYAYHWVFRRHFPETIVEFEEKTREFLKFNIESTDELLEQQSLNQFVDCIESGKDFIYQE